MLPRVCSAWTLTPCRGQPPNSLAAERPQHGDPRGQGGQGSHQKTVPGFGDATPLQAKQLGGPHRTSDGVAPAVASMTLCSVALGDSSSGVPAKGAAARPKKRRDERGRHVGLIHETGSADSFIVILDNHDRSVVVVVVVVASFL